MKMLLRVSVLISALLLVSGFTECYKPVTRSELPPHIKTVAVPAFQNNALRFKIEHRFTEAVMNELIRRGINIAPTIEIRPGYAFNVMVTQDLVFPGPYDDTVRP